MADLCVCDPEITHLAFCEDWDSYWDRTCGRWVELPCGDLECETCRDRPPSHLQVIHDIP